MPAHLRPSEVPCPLRPALCSNLCLHAAAAIMPEHGCQRALAAPLRWGQHLAHPAERCVPLAKLPRLLTLLLSRLLQLALPYWMESEDRVSARWKLAGVFALTLGTTGVRCVCQAVCCLQAVFS